MINGVLKLIFLHLVYGSISFTLKMFHCVLPKSEVGVFADNQVVEHVNAHDLACFKKKFGYFGVFVWGVGVAGGVIMRDDERRGMAADSSFEGFAGMDQAWAECADKNSV